jgi:hypothetical protein
VRSFFGCISGTGIEIIKLNTLKIYVSSMEMWANLVYNVLLRVIIAIVDYSNYE